MKHRLSTFIAVFTITVATLIFGSFQNDVKAGSSTLIFGHPAETDILDPHATGGWLTYEVTYQIFEGFVKEDLTDPNAATPKLIPGLATSCDISDDG